MRRTRSRHVGRSEPIGATTPNRNGLVTRLAWSFIVVLLESGTDLVRSGRPIHEPATQNSTTPPKNVDTSIGDEPPWSAITPQIAGSPGNLRSRKPTRRTIPSTSVG